MIYNSQRLLWNNLSLGGRIIIIIGLIIWAFIPTIVGLLLFLNFGDQEDLLLCYLTIVNIVAELIIVPFAINNIRI